MATLAYYKEDGGNLLEAVVIGVLIRFRVHGLGLSGSLVGFRVQDAGLRV